jgi:hypothetical protein
LLVRNCFWLRNLELGFLWLNSHFVVDLEYCGAAGLTDC